MGFRRLRRRGKGEERAETDDVAEKSSFRDLINVGFKSEVAAKYHAKIADVTGRGLGGVINGGEWGNGVSVLGPIIMRSVLSEFNRRKFFLIQDLMSAKQLEREGTVVVEM